VEPATPPAEPLSLPLVVSDYYSPDGFFGDGETRHSLELERSCPARPPGAAGDCYTLTYRPGARRFAGIFWQYPHNNWGFWPGHSIQPGASRITFQARGQRGGEPLKVNAGQKDSANQHKDSFQLEELSVPLATEWRGYELPLQDADYRGPSGVIGAFMIALAATDDDAPVVVYLDDIRWR